MRIRTAKTYKKNKAHFALGIPHFCWAPPITRGRSKLLTLTSDVLHSLVLRSLGALSATLYAMTTADHRRCIQVSFWAFLGSVRYAHAKRQREANVRTAHTTPCVPMFCGLI